MPIEEDDKSVPPGPPESYRAVAKGLMPGIRVLAATQGEIAKDVALSLSMLCAHALECALKALLFKNGTQSGLENSHDIEKLWMRAEQGPYLPPMPMPMPAWAKDLSGLHAHPYHLRYREEATVLVTPSVQPMGEELGKIIEKVEEVLRG